MPASTSPGQEPEKEPLRAGAPLLEMLIFPNIVTRSLAHDGDTGTHPETGTAQRPATYADYGRLSRGRRTSESLAAKKGKEKGSVPRDAYDSGRARSQGSPLRYRSSSSCACADRGG